jgi:putative membrane protein
LNSALLAFVHHALAFLLVSALMVELVLMKNELTLQSARSILRMDALYGICAGLLLVVGFGRVFHTEKGSGYYFSSAPFIAKISLFLIVGLLSIYPTMQFLKWRKELAAGQVPQLDPARRRTIRMIVHLELTLLFIVMLCAALMARGVGVIG